MFNIFVQVFYYWRHRKKSRIVSSLKNYDAFLSRWFLAGVYESFYLASQRLFKDFLPRLSKYFNTSTDSGATHIKKLPYLFIGFYSFIPKEIDDQITLVFIYTMQSLCLNTFINISLNKFSRFYYPARYFPGILNDIIRLHIQFAKLFIQALTAIFLINKTSWIQWVSEKHSG